MEYSNKRDFDGFKRSLCLKKHIYACATREEWDRVNVARLEEVLQIEVSDLFFQRKLYAIIVDSLRECLMCLKSSKRFSLPELQVFFGKKQAYCYLKHQGYTTEIVQLLPSHFGHLLHDNMRSYALYLQEVREGNVNFPFLHSYRNRVLTNPQQFHLYYQITPVVDQNPVFELIVQIDKKEIGRYENEMH